MFNWIKRLWYGSRSVEKPSEKVVRSGNLFDEIRACQERQKPFVVGYVKLANSEQLEAIRVAVDGHYTGRSQVSFVAYQSEEALRRGLERLAMPCDSPLELILESHDPKVEQLSPGRLYARAHDTRKIDKSYDVEPKLA